MASMESRVTTLEANHKEVMSNINEIKNNHIFHLAQDISRLNDKVDKINLTIAKWAGIIIGAMFIVQFLAQYLPSILNK